MRYLGFLGYALGGISAASAAAYVVVYLYRWEWQRALVSGVLLLVIEIFLATALVLGRMARLHRRLAETDARAEEVLRRLERTRAASPDRFRWLDRERDTFVFVPVLVAAGAALSVVAAIVQRIAGATVRAGRERRLAGRLASLAAPPGGIGGGRTPGLENEPAVPPRRTRRGVALALATPLLAVLIAGAVDVLSDATQTRPQAPPDSAATTVVFRIEVREVPDDATAVGSAALDLWESCRRATSALRGDAALTALGDGVFAGVLRPALPEHDLKRLHGCLSDATANRALATVLGQGQATEGG